MSFRYVNPGYVYLLNPGLSTSQFTGFEYSKTGVAFQLTDTVVGGVTIPQFQQGNDFWARFDVYLKNSMQVYLYVPSANSSGFYLYYNPLNSNLYRVCAVYNGTEKEISTGTATELGIINGAINTIVGHVVYGDINTACVEVFINNKKFSTSAPNAITWSTSYHHKTVWFYSKEFNTRFSNIIFSDTEISPKEQVIALPISATATDMAAGAGGMYTATAAGQTLLQTPDITALAQQFSGESKITGIQVVGNPAYKTSTGLETMISLSKSGNVTTEHGSYTLGTDSTALVMDGWSLSGVTLAGLSTMQFGWKTAD